MNLRNLAIFGAILMALAALLPLDAHGMERGEMDQVLALARTRPDAPEFRAALVKHLGEAGIASGDAYNSNGHDFIWAVESSAVPSIVIDDQPAGPMRQIAGSQLWFHVAQLRVGTSHRFHNHHAVGGRRRPHWACTQPQGGRHSGRRPPGES